MLIEERKWNHINLSLRLKKKSRKGEGRKNKSTKAKSIKKFMVDINLPLSIITLNVNCLNTPTKK